MQQQEFIDQVKNRTNLTSPDEADLAIRATLETLAECLTKEEAQNASSQLPKLIKDYLTPQWTSGDQHLTLDEFYHRVSEREKTDLSLAKNHAQVVIGVMSETVTPGEMDDVRAQLAPEFNPLFQEVEQQEKMLR